MISIRAARHQDSQALSEIYGPVVRDTVISFEADPPDGAEMARRIAASAPQWPWLVAERNGQVVGYACGRPYGDRAAYRWSAKTSIFVAAGARRQGVGRALYAALAPIMKVQGYHALFAGITLPNAASVGLHEAAGFLPQGRYEEAGHKFGGWWDVGYWRLALSEPVENPGEPIPFAEISKTDAVRAILCPAGP
jgi:L-amino acid N-acyltransferase YncA